MNAIIGTEYPALDHGFVRVVDVMGNDAAITQAARVSYGSGTEKKSTDRGLIRYLMRHWHTTPFEMCEIKLHVKLPIFVARQWIRHRTANVNEYSARYSIMDNEFYIPEIEDIQPQSKTNKQGRDGDLPAMVRDEMRQVIISQSNGAYNTYEWLRTGSQWFHRDGSLIDPEHDDLEPYTDVEHGMAREMARMVLPPNIYTQWYWKVDLHNLFHFLRLRADPHAQKEIRVYAEAICQIVKQWCPVAYEAFEDYRLHAVTFSRQEMEILKRMVQPDFGGCIDPELTSGLSDRELTEFKSRWGLS